MQHSRLKVLFVLFFILGLQIATSFHYHKDKSAATNRCPVCILGHQVKQTVVSASFTFHQTQAIEKNIVIPLQDVLVNSFQSNIRSRAPPTV